MVREAIQIQLTCLEKDLLDAFHRRHASMGFPASSEIRVLRRENTGAGRWTFITHDKPTRLDDWSIGFGAYSQINMEGIPDGMSIDVEIEDGKAARLTMTVNGIAEWDGVERRPWELCDPDTGIFSGPPDGEDD